MKYQPKVMFFSTLEELAEYHYSPWNNPVPEVPAPTPQEQLVAPEQGIVAGPLPSRVPSLPESFAILARIKACPSWSKPGCGCAFGECSLGKGKGGRVSFQECRECLEISP